jgi:hypothetical protein
MTQLRSASIAIAATMKVDLKQAHPNEPWLWRAQWAAGEIHSSAKPGAIAVSALAVFWNASPCQAQYRRYWLMTCAMSQNSRRSQSFR